MVLIITRLSGSEDGSLTWPMVSQINTNYKLLATVPAAQGSPQDSLGNRKQYLCWCQDTDYDNTVVTGQCTGQCSGQPLSSNKQTSQQQNIHLRTSPGGKVGRWGWWDSATDDQITSYSRGDWADTQPGHKQDLALFSVSALGREGRSLCWNYSALKEEAIMIKV